MSEKPNIEQSILKGATVGRDLTIGSIQQTVNQPPSLPPLTTPPNNVPYLGSTRFTGREDELTELHQLLQRKGSVAITAVQGMGGIGKTELAVQYAKQKISEYPSGICWLSPRSGDVLVQLITYAQGFVPDVRKKLDENVSLAVVVGYIWNHWPVLDNNQVQRKVLVIFDDVQKFTEIEDCLPKDERYRVIVTTRYQFKNVHPFPLDVLKPDKALELLGEFIGAEQVNQDLNIVTMLCSWLGNLPLGIELVGAYIRDRSLPLGTALARLKEQRLSARMLQMTSGDGQTAPRGVIQAFELS